jgi:hypothetical protein
MRGTVLYISFIGLRAFYERKIRCLKSSAPLAVAEDDLVIDCDEVAWNCGIRIGDTSRQCKIASPGCQIVRVCDISAAVGSLTPILDILTRISPYIEPSPDWRGVFR